MRQWISMGIPIIVLPFGSQGYPQDTDYYTLEDATAKSIESVSAP
jgi:hypothetical protein